MVEASCGDRELEAEGKMFSGPFFLKENWPEDADLRTSQHIRETMHRHTASASLRLSQKATPAIARMFDRGESNFQQVPCEKRDVQRTLFLMELG